MTRLWHFPLLQGSAHFGTKHSLHIGGIASTAGQPQQLQDALVGPNKPVVTIARLMYKSDRNIERAKPHHRSTRLFARSTCRNPAARLDSRKYGNPLTRQMSAASRPVLVAWALSSRSSGAVISMLLFLAGRHTRVTLVSVQYVGGKDWGTCGIRHTLQT